MPTSNTGRSLASKAEQTKLRSMYSTTQKQSRSTFGTLVTLAINAAIIYYVIGLEKDKCKCVRDWRHDYIKYYTAVMITLGLLSLSGVVNIGNAVTGASSQIYIILGLVLSLIMLAAVGFQIYSIFTYVGDLNKTKCTCATEDMQTLNRAMLVLRWFYVAGAVVITLWLLVVLSRMFLGLVY